MYCVLGVLAARAALGSSLMTRTMVAVIAAVAVFGAVDEWHQRFIPGRSQDVADWAADSLGGACGILAVALRARRDPLT